MQRYIVFLCFFISLHCYCKTPAPKREFRAVWVATVANIDWPSKPGLPTIVQKKEISEIAKNALKLGLNAIILQVRPESDALFPSKTEPWSRYLSGKQGQAPVPYYDPLQTWIDECHKYGLEFHAWLNPFRVSNNHQNELAPSHPAVNQPDWVVSYGEKKLFDPGNPEVRKHLVNIVKEIVTQYPVDGIHMDDYFYPYPENGISFNDSASFAKFNRGFPIDSIDDWRRENVSMTIKAIHDIIKNIKPWVKFGVSPFGVWRNNSDDERGSDTQAGLTNYDHLYADVYTWLKNGWLDYVSPQLYWSREHPVVGFDTLIEWWNENSFGTDIYVGHALYKINSPQEAWQTPSQMPQQLAISRNQPMVKGNIFFSYNHIKKDLLGLKDSLKINYYSSKALVPPTTSPYKLKNNTPQILKSKGKKIQWVSTGLCHSTAHTKFVIYRWQEGDVLNFEDPRFIYAISRENELIIPRTRGPKKKYFIAISELDQYNQESNLSTPIMIKMRATKVN